MAEEGFKRKLAAILSADVEGYSRLMDQDEEATIRTLTTYRSAITDLVQQYRGRVVDTPGDNILAEFTSVVDAVNCAVEIQRELAERNEDLSEDKRMQFRIGVNLGDVVEEKGRIYGDGVNIAARVESMANAGSICISGWAYDQVANKLGLEYDNLGEHQVKNISQPIRVYRVLSFPGAAAHRVIQAKETVGKQWRKTALVIAAVLVLGVGAALTWNFFLRQVPPSVEPASVERMAFPLPDKPSIAVLPFTNLSDDPEQEYLSDGIAENIITALSSVPTLFVIARNSTFTYKGKPVKVQRVAEELGIRYVLEGSLQRSGDRVRINTQLIDALTGSHLWAKRYDREIKDIFALQDEISLQVLQALRIKLVTGTSAWGRSGTNNLDAYLYYTRGLAIWYRQTKDDNLQARQLWKKALELDREFHMAKTLLAFTHWLDARMGWRASSQESFRQAMDLAQEARAEDPSNPMVYRVLNALHLLKREHEKAIEFAEKAVALDPNGPLGRAMLAFALVYAGRPEEAIALYKTAMRLSPVYPTWFLWHLGLAYHLTGEYEKAVEVLESSLDRNPDTLFPHVRLAAIYAEMGRMEEARAAVAEVLRIDPKFTVNNWAKAQPFKNPATLEHRNELMRKAGLTE